MEQSLSASALSPDPVNTIIGKVWWSLSSRAVACARLSVSVDKWKNLAGSEIESERKNSLKREGESL